MAVVPPPSPDSPPSLDLEPALQLLLHSGRSVPPGDPTQPGWLQSVVDALVEVSSRDSLTGLANRRAFELAVIRELDRVARSGESALMLALDIDHFKRVNDTYGHNAGDLVIQAVSRVLLETVRPMDLVARVGGEEFSILLPNCPVAFGEAVAERIRRKVLGAPVVIAPGQAIPVAVSIGGAFAPQWVRSTPTLWIERADQQLYRAKQEGRNRVRLEPTLMSQVTVDERRMLFDQYLTQDPR